MADRLGISNKPPYFDDFDSSKNYSKILFRPGRAIQSRELTQIQTILQNQISTIGDRIITSPIVSGGDFQVTNVKYLKFYYLGDPSFLKDKLVIFGENQILSRIKVIDVTKNIDSFDNNYVMFFEYRDGTEFTTAINLNPLPLINQTYVATVIDESTLSQTNFTFNIKGVPNYNTLSEADRNPNTGLLIHGDALLVRLSPGVFYKRGFSISTKSTLLLPLQTLIQSSGSGKYLNYAPSIQNTRVGLKLTQKFITFETDPTLYDPSAGFYNFASPGADRLQIDPSLIQMSFGQNFENTIELADIINGSIRVVDSSFKKRKRDPNCDSVDKVLKPFILDIIGATLNINSGRALVNCTDIEVIENQAVSLVKESDNILFSNQAFNDQCLSEAIIVQSNNENPLFSGVGGTGGAANDYTLTNTNYFGSGKIRKLFSDEATRLEIVNCDGIKIGCLTVLDIEKNDETSYRIYFNELQSYISTISTSMLFAEACTLSLDGEKVFSVESPVSLTCTDTTPGGKQRLVYKVPKGSNVRSVFDADYMITRDFVSDIKTSIIPGTQEVPTNATIVEFDMDIPNGVFNDNNYPTANVDMFTVVLNGKAVPLKRGNGATPHIRINESKTRVTVVLTSDQFPATSSDNETRLVLPSAGKCYLITKVRFPEKSSGDSSAAASTPLPHRKKILKEARGVYLQNLAKNRTISLGYSDVYLLKSVTDSTGTNVTDKFIFDDGQRNDRYDHATITLVSGEIPDGNEKEYTVEFRYFEHEPIAPGFYGPITVNSYGFDKDGIAIPNFHGFDLNGQRMTLGYDEIPNFLDRISGEVISLADAVDFRMFRTQEGLIENKLNKSSILRARWFPSPDSSAAVEASYKLDLPRIDLLVLREDGKFSLLSGEPSTNPVPPEYPKDGCVVAEINVPGTIVSSEDFIIKKPFIKSISLPELNDMQNRIAELEKSLSIQTLENKARAQSAVLRNEFLTGMLIDDFGGHYVGDVSNDEYNCSIDFSKGSLRAPFTCQFFDFIPNTGYPTTVVGEKDYFIMAEENVSGVTIVANDQGTTEVTVNPVGSSNWQGYLSLDRPYQLWVDQTTKPIVRNNTRGQNDAWEAGGECVQSNGRKNGFGTQWAFWKSLWFGESLLTSTVIEKDRSSAKGFADTIINAAPSRFSRSVNKDTLMSFPKKTIGNGGFGLTDSKTNRYVDSGLSFFSPENYLIIRGTSLKPNTSFSVFFENMVSPILSSRILDLQGNQLTNLISDSSGNLNFVLYVPNGAYITGNKVIKIVENTQSTKKSFASCVYSNNGSAWKNLAENDDTTVEFETLPIGRTDVLLTNENTLYADEGVINGVYQKFFVDNTENPDGIIIDKIGVYFSRIDLSLPVSIEIRKVFNGEVDYHKIIRNSRIEATPTTKGYNEFRFTKSVYLSPGEYSLAIRSNSSLYAVHVSQKGETRVDESAVLLDGEVFANSVFGCNGFFGGSSLTQAEDTNTTLRFYLHRKSFKTGGGIEKQAQFRLPLFNGTNSTVDFDTLYFSNDNWRTTTGNVVYTLKASQQKIISSNTDNDGSGNISTSTSRLGIVVTTNKESISPIVDIRKLGLLTVKNRLSKTVDVTKSGAELKNFGGSDGSVMKYITRRTDLRLPANVLRTSFDAMLPEDFDIRVYGKLLYEGDTDFDNQVYTEMKRISGDSNVSKNSFGEMIFELDATSSAKNFISFSVKVIITANGSTTTDRISFYPEIKNLTVVSSVR